MAKAVPAIPQKVDTFGAIDLIAFAISIVLLGTNYLDTNGSFFITVLILILSPCLRKIWSLIIGDLPLFDSLFFKITNIIEMILLIAVSTICILGLLGVMTICKVTVESTQFIKVCVVEGYVFLAGKGFDLRICIGALFIIMGLKLLHSISKGVMVK